MAARFTTNTKGFNRIVTRPSSPLPQNACDAHMHIIGPLATFPLRETGSLTPPESTWDDYAKIATTIGLERCVVVQPSVFADDNACTLDAVVRSGGRARAVVVVRESVTPSEIADMHARGARGVRLQTLVKGGTSVDSIKAIAERIAPFGWHVQLYLDSRTLPDIVGRLSRLAVPIVFDHMAHVAREDGPDEPGFQHLLRLVGEGRAWAKLCNPQGPASAEHARRLINANSDHVVWGSDWPHLAWQGDPPDDGKMIDLIGDWTQDQSIREKILIQNPDRLYFRD